MSSMMPMKPYMKIGLRTLIPWSLGLDLKNIGACKTRLYKPLYSENPKSLGGLAAEISVLHTDAHTYRIKLL